MTKAYGLKGSVDYLWEQRKIKGKRISEFTQVYDLIFSRRLQPLYDASLKFEFRSETRNDEKDREKTQLLPSLNMRLGHELMNLNSGWSMDTINDEKGSYTTERVYTGLNWRPKKLPQILIQIQDQKREESWEADVTSKETRITINEDYQLTLGLFTFDHSFNQSTTNTDEKETTTYDLLNTGRIRQQFSFLNEGLDIRTGFETSQGQNKEQDGDLNRTWKHDIFLNIIGYPAEWIQPEYKVFWGENKDTQPYKRETLMGHNLNLLLIPHPYLSSTMGINYNQTDTSEDPGFRDSTTYTLKLEPSLQGLIFDPNTSMYPIKTSLLLSNSTVRREGARESYTMSSLLTGSTTVYEGVDLDLDIGLREIRSYISDSRELEKTIDAHFNLNIMPSLKGSVRQKAKWERERRGIIKTTDFEGSLEPRLVYRPVETFIFDIGYFWDYEDKGSGYHYNFKWLPTSKMELDVRYQSSTRERRKYFSGELNISMTHTIRLGLRYQYPTEEQMMEVQFKLRF